MQTYLTPGKRRSDLADGVLVQQAQSGDHGAFELLVDRYSDLLWRLIRQMVRDEHLAQDVLQYVFLQLYAHYLPCGSVGRSPGGYARWRVTAVLMNCAAGVPSSSLRSRLSQMGTNFPAFLPCSTQICSRRSRPNKTSYANRSAKLLRRCPCAIAQLCCCAMPAN